MLIYHGTKNAKNFNIKDKYIASGKKSRAQNGSGLYTTTSYETAQNYGKIIVLELSIDKKNEAKNIKIPVEEINDFLLILPKSKQKAFKEIHERMIEKQSLDGKTIDAQTFQTMMLLSNEDKFHLIAQDVNDFLVDHKVKYTVSLYNGYPMIQIHDFDIIKNKLEFKDIKEEDVKVEYNDDLKKTRKMKP